MNYETLIWFEGAEHANYVNMLDDKAWEVAITDGCIFPSGTLLKSLHMVLGGLGIALVVDHLYNILTIFPKA